MKYSHIIFILIVVVSFDSYAMLKLRELQKKMQEAQTSTPQIEIKNSTALVRSQEQRLTPENITFFVDKVSSYANVNDENRLRQALFILHLNFKGNDCRQIRQELSEKLVASNTKIILYPCSCCLTKSQ